MSFVRNRLRLIPRGAIAAAISLGVLALCALHWWHPGAVIANGDSSPQLDPGIWFTNALGAWSDRNNYFGQIDGGFSLAPFMVLWWLFDGLVGPGLGEIALFASLLCAAWLGAFCFARRCGATVAAATICAWVYAANPYTQVTIATLSSTQCAFLAILPWLGFFVMTAARLPARRRYATAALALLALVAVPMLGITPQLVFQFAIAAVLVAIFCGFFARDVPAFARWAGGAALVMIAVSLWWAVPDVLSFVGAVIPHPIDLSGNAWTYARSSLLNNERFLYTWGWSFAEYFPDASAYDGNPFTYAAGFLPFAGGLAGLILLRGRLLCAARYAMACTLVVLFLSKGAHPPLADLSALLWKIPGVFFFDDPAGGSILALLLLSVVTAAAFDALRLHRARIPTAAAIVAIAGLSAVLLFSGAVFHGAVDAPDGFDSPSVYVRVPAYWHAAAEYLNDDRRSGGVLLLPPNLNEGYDVSYDWGFYGGDGLPQNLISRRLLYLDRGLVKGGGYLKHALAQAQSDNVQALLDARSPLVLAVLRGIGVRFVLFRNDLFDPRHVWLSDVDVARVLGREPIRFGALSIYDVGVPAPTVFFKQAWRHHATAFRVDAPTRTYVDEPVRAVRAGTLALGMLASQDLSMEIHSASAPPPATASLTVSIGNRRFVCPFFLPPNQMTDVNESIIPCLRRRSIVPTMDGLQHVLIRSVAFYEPRALRHQDGRIVITARDGGARVLPVLSPGAAVSNAGDLDACSTAHAYCTAGVMSARIPAGFNGLVVLGQLFSPSWIALEIGHGIHVPSHVLVDAWRNGWLVSGEGLLLIVNAVLAFQLLALLFALGMVAWQVSRVRS